MLLLAVSKTPIVIPSYELTLKRSLLWQMKSRIRPRNSVFRIAASRCAHLVECSDSIPNLEMVSK
jgi:hypothetical protein